MAFESSLLSLLLEELAKLSAEEVAGFCGETYFQQTQLRFHQGQIPQLWKLSPAANHENVQVISFESEDHQLIELALLRSQWEIYSNADRLTYRFFRKEFTAALFARPGGGDLTLGRQHLADVFTLLWLMTRPKEVLMEWGKIKTKLDSLSADLAPLLQQGEGSHHLDDSVKALLICVPTRDLLPAETERVMPSAQPPMVYQGQLFKVHNPTALKAKSMANDAASMGTLVEKYGLAQLQILLRNGKILPLKDNEDIISYLENHRSEKADRRMLDKMCKIKDDDSLILRSFERNKFNLIDKFFAEGKEVHLVFGYSHSVERPSVLAKSFDVQSFGGIYYKPTIGIKLHSGVGRLALELEPPAMLTNALVTNQIAFDFSSGKLIFHDLHQLGRSFAHFMGERNSEQNLLKHLLDLRESGPVEGHRKVLSFLKNLHTHFGKELVIPTIREIRAEQMPKVELSVDRESFRLIHHLEITGRALKFCNFAPEWREILKGLEDGLIETASSSDIAMAYSVRRSQRQHETKFLKHVGIFITILHSALEWSLQQQGLGKSKPLFYEELWQKIVLLILPRPDGNHPETIDQLLSTKVKKIALDYIESLLDCLDPHYESVLILEDQILHIPGLIREQAKILFFWIHNIAQFTKGDVFAKASGKYLPTHWNLPKVGEEHLSLNEMFVLEDGQNALENARTYVHSYGTRNLESLYQIPLSAWARLSQTFPEILIRLDGRPLEQLSAEQFQVNFELQNTADQGATGQGRIDWFSLNPKYFLNGKEINEIDAKKLTFDGVLEYQGRFYVLDSNNFPSQRALELFWTRLQYNQHKAPRGQKGQVEEATAPRHHVLELLALRRMGIPFQGPKEWQEICAYYDHLSQPRGQLDLGDKLNKTLKPYQLAGVQWLWDLYQLRIGGILADDMGLGKTAQALSFLQYGYHKNEIKRVLVIVPVSLTFNWLMESEKFTPDLNVSVFDPKSKETLNANVIICTYSLLSLHHKQFEKEAFDVIIFDEAQYLKNIGTNRFKSSENIKARFKIALTGTPIENNLSELFALFQLVAPGLLGTRQDFQRHYVKPDELPEENIEFLRAKLKPLILRRRKQDLSLELPDKTENQLFVEFSKKQKELYRNTALSWSQKVYESINQKGTSQSKLYMLTALLRLRQVCSDPAALPSVSYKEIPPKISILIDMLEEITEEGHSAIVFTQFMSTFARLKELFKKHNIKSYEMHGGTPRKDRETLLKEFSNESSEKGSVLLMTLKTGGVGLNLTRASYVFHLEPWWNPAVENQATDRVHRLGQKKNVTVYRLIMKESVEEKVEQLKQRKAQLFNNLFGDDYFSLESVEDSGSSEKVGATTITKEDFDMLIQ